MTTAFRSLLYREPHLYDLVFPDADETISAMVRTAIGRFLPSMPRSMLDMGCGTGRHLEPFAGIIPDRHGVDLLESNITYARSVRRPSSSNGGWEMSFPKTAAWCPATMLVLAVFGPRAYGTGFAGCVMTYHIGSSQPKGWWTERSERCEGCS